jgi:hypothetical protein
MTLSASIDIILEAEDNAAGAGKGPDMTRPEPKGAACLRPRSRFTGKADLGRTAC